MRRIVSRCLIVVTLTVLFVAGSGCDVSAGGGTGPIIIESPFPGTTSGCSDDVLTADLAAQAVALGNAERIQAGVPALTVDPVLTAVAEEYARTQAIEGFTGHTDLNGDGVDQRVTDAGYDWTAVAENLAYGPCTAEGAIDGWMNSEGHRTNLLHTALTETGVGVYRGGAFEIYWVQVFATPR